MNLKIDCRYFPGDRPCTFHKEEGISCSTCPHYASINQKILIIKLGAMGDVLRTTAILKPIKKQFPDSFITWVTLTPSLDFFIGNSLVDEVLDVSQNAFPRILSEQYDLILNPDADRLSASLATLTQAGEKRGFGINKKGKVFPFNPEAERWLEMGAFDDLKKANQLTYQEIILSLLKLPQDSYTILLSLLPDELEEGQKFAAGNNLLGPEKIIGLNSGAGERWQIKGWTEQGFEGLMEKILAETNDKILLYGGPDSEKRNNHLYAQFSDSDRVVNTGTNNPLRKFLSLLNLSDLIVTGDTMALHAGLALGKKVVGLFGPTSATEIDMYSRGIKLTGTVDCLCCYRLTCNKIPTCMETVTPEMVFNAVKELLGK